MNRDTSESWLGPNGRIVRLTAFVFGSYHLLVVAGLLTVSTMPVRLTHVLLASACSLPPDP